MIGTTSQNRPRTPGYVFSALAVLIVVLVGVFALANRQPPPPSIAEFAPQAVEQIKETQANQTFGGGLGSAAPPPPPPPAAGGQGIEAARVKRCVGIPPRQTEDPQSPPCIAYFQGDNGGATSKGVTKDEIRIAVPNMENPPNPYYKALESHFNKRYQFYGRSWRFIGFPDPDKGEFKPCEKIASDAIKVDEELQAFASINYGAQQGRETCYYDELARRKVISVGASFMGTPSTTERRMTEFAPYQWNYYATLDTILINVGELTCNQLAGRSPAYAGTKESTAPVRKFGVVVDTFASGSTAVDTKPLIEASRRCGVEWVQIDANLGQHQQAPQWQEASNGPILKLKEAGVTTVMYLGWYPILNQGLMRSATANEYFPEWIVQNYQKQDDDQTGIGYDFYHTRHVIGLRTWSKSQTRADRWSWQFIREENPNEKAHTQNFSPDYWNFIVLASGIQMAGPRLTPESFQRGLFNTKFPNPGCGGPPDYQACVGFGPTSHAMTKDFALTWWDPNQTSVEYDSTAPNETNQFYRDTNAPRGAFCYVGKGERFAVGKWKKEEPRFWTGDCR